LWQAAGWSCRGFYDDQRCDRSNPFDIDGRREIGKVDLDIDLSWVAACTFLDPIGADP
jgi:hypothetical protein